MLIACPECGGSVSQLAQECPLCGYPVAQYIEQLRRREYMRRNRKRFEAQKRLRREIILVFLVFVAILVLTYALHH